MTDRSGADVMVRMDDNGIRFNRHARVRLRDTVDPAIYGDFACVGNEGWVRDIREDRFGLPEILIEWDKNHWAYNGIQDGWTFPDHFEAIEAVEETMKDNNKRQVQDLVMEFAKGLVTLFSEDTPSSFSSEPSKTKPNAARILADAARPFTQQQSADTPDDEYSQAVEAATEKLAESDGFIVIGVDRHSDPRSHDGILEPYAYGYSRSPDVELAIQAHMAGVTARSHQQLALSELQRLQDPS